jgi:Dolichyl-phosphate-mannose-protein mannosyltransferase
MKKGTQLLAVLLLGLLLTVQGIPLHSVVRAYPLQTLCILLLSAWLVTGPRAQRLRNGVAPLFRMSRLRFNLLLFFLAAGAYAFIAWFLFKGIPRLDDGMASLFQARLFAQLAITLPLPADAAFVDIFGVLGQKAGLGHWCGMYPPGWPLLLTPGVWLHAPWLVNPVLGGLLIVTIHELGRDFFDDRTGRLAALIAIPSPLIAVLAGLHLSHIPAALACALCLLGLRKLWETLRWIWGGAAGLLWGIGFLCRPLDAAVLGAVFALGFLLPPRRLLQCKGGIAAGLVMAVIAISLLFGFQYATTGDARTPGHEIGLGARGQFGFVQLDEIRTHTPAIGLEDTGSRVRILNENLLGWPLPALALVLLSFLLGRAKPNDWLLLLPIPALLATYACYWYFEACVPARYISVGIPYAFILAARGLFTLRDALASRGLWAKLPAFVVVSGAFFLGISTPEMLRRYAAVNYYDVENILPRVVRDYEISNALVFMDSLGRDPVRPDCFNDYYATGFMRNELDLEGDVLYVRNRREANLELMNRHPDRTAWLYRYRRDAQQAQLYRMVLDGEEIRMLPVAPTTPELAVIPN